MAAITTSTHGEHLATGASMTIAQMCASCCCIYAAISTTFTVSLGENLATESLGREGGSYVVGLERKLGYRRCWKQLQSHKVADFVSRLCSAGFCCLRVKVNSCCRKVDQ